ncbi:hypothetical protein CEP51_013879 [Fusarium floridanum]|uniref:Uncharacterized protein n=1 Tax=Fusarium floridanum TaxID=1325733 RepID=A0A428Q366_9HYPO|nr:hypothetical protein CEP51_013879 [Fusarium floridanum]
MKGFPWVHPGEDNFASGEVTGLCVGSIVLLLGFVVSFIWKQKRLDQANKHASTSSRFSRFNLVRTALLILPFLIAACTGSALVRMFMAMQKIRQDIQKYGKDEYEDNEWGFGQVMAVIVWVQYVGDLVTILIDAFTNDDEEKTSQVERKDVTPPANINQPRREASQATSSSPVPNQTENMDSVEQVSPVFYIWSNLSNGLAIKPIFGCRDAHNAGTPKVNLDQEWGGHVPTGMTFVISPRGMDIPLEEHAGSEDDAITPILGHQGQGLRGETHTDHKPQAVDDTMRDSRKERKRKLRLALIILGRIGLIAIQIGVIFGA